MRTVGQILRENREAKFYTLEQVERAIKIRQELLEALEEDDYARLPPPTFIQGFIKNYAKFLNLDSKNLLAVFRREFAAEKHHPYVMEAFSKPMSKTQVRITPGRVLGVAISLIILSFFAYLWFQYRQLVGAPPLTLASPSEQLTTDNPNLVVEGKTEPELKVLVNSQEIPLDESGHFKQTITLSQAVSKIEVVAISKFGQKTKVERTVYLNR